MAHNDGHFSRAEFRVGTRLRDKYLIDNVLGVGGMSVVYAATHRNRKRFAIKMLHPEFSNNENFRKRFIREGYIANSVGHAGVVEVLDDDTAEDGSVFLVMELLDGICLESAGASQGAPIPVREALSITYQLLDVLDAAHTKGIIHRDIKPANIFITKSGMVKVLDFGIARFRDSAPDLTSTRTGAWMGTPAFMSPEQALAKQSEIDVRADIWAVGATLFTMLSGECVHKGDNAAHILVCAATEPADSLGKIAPDLPRPLVAVVDKALAFEKEARFQSAALMREALAEVLSILYGPCDLENLSSFVETAFSNAMGAVGNESTSEVVGRTEIATAEPWRREFGDDAALPPPSIQSHPESAAKQTIASWRACKLGALLGMVAIAISVTGHVMRCISEQKPGIITVAVTTDMSVPTDFDRLSWTITQEGGEVILKRGAVTLSDWKQLPIDLVTVSTTDTRDPVRFQLDARRGGERGRLIYRRNVDLQVPVSGETRLTISIDWMCTEDFSPSPCKTGRVCRAGDCVAPSLISPSVESKHPANGVARCFDVQRCFASGVVSTVPYRDPATGQCVLAQYNALLNNGRANLALIVNTAKVGNYGVCGPAGNHCLIPLAGAGPNAWHIIKENDKVTGIRLPSHACSDKLLGVAMAPAISGCPIKSESMPICPAPDTCIEADEVCPASLPDAFVGYSCSGTASPQMIRKDLIGCWVSAEEKGDKTKRTALTGRWCCSTGEQPSRDPLLIDDMTGGNQVKLIPPEGYVDGFWWTATDAAEGTITPSPHPRLFMYRSIHPKVPIDTNRNIERAACLKSSGFAGTDAKMGFGFIYDKKTENHAYFNVSPFTGIRFWAYSPGGEQKITVGFPDQNTYTEDPRSTCNRNPSGGRCGDAWAIQQLTLTPTWKEYFVKWSDLKQTSNDWGQARFESFDAARVFTTYFAVRGDGPTKMSPPFDFCISEIYFTRQRP